MNRKGHFSFDMGPVGNFIFFICFWGPLETVYRLGLPHSFIFPVCILWTVGFPAVIFLVVRRLFRK